MESKELTLKEALSLIREWHNETTINGATLKAAARSKKLKTTLHNDVPVPYYTVTLSDLKHWFNRIYNPKMRRHMKTPNF